MEGALLLCKGSMKSIVNFILSILNHERLLVLISPLIHSTRYIYILDGAGKETKTVNIPEMEWADSQAERRMNKVSTCRGN